MTELLPLNVYPFTLNEKQAMSAGCGKTKPERVVSEANMVQPKWLIKIIEALFVKI